jgi:hypothetical protein
MPVNFPTVARFQQSPDHVASAHACACRPAAARADQLPEAAIHRVAVGDPERVGYAGDRHL